MKYIKWEILKEPLYNKWVVWEVYPNIRVELFKAKTKKECKKFLEEYKEVKGIRS